MLSISFKVSVRPSRNSNACARTQKTRAPQASNGTDSGLKFRKRITCKIAYPCNDLHQFWLHFVENDHIFPANARKNSWFTDQNFANQEKQMRIPFLILIYFFSGLKVATRELILRPICLLWGRTLSHKLYSRVHYFLSENATKIQKFFNPHHLNVFESIN